MSKIQLDPLKRDSRQLRGSIGRELETPGRTFSDPSKQLLKFHGVYQQDDRDTRAERKREGSDRDWSFMIRCRIPGGRLASAQYLAIDDLAGRYANGTLRITTRQTLQLHGVIRDDLRGTLRELDRNLMTAYAACGDVVRNVICCPAATGGPVQEQLHKLAERISSHFLPRSGAYHEIWLDGKQQTREQPDPIYGETYLPRKFKIAIQRPGDNCVDVWTQDVGMIPVLEDERVVAYELLAGGGLGMTHNKPETFPRLADRLGRVAPDRVVESVQAIVTTQRDHGDRKNRRHARLKYLIHDRGLPWFRRQVEQRQGFPFGEPGPLEQAEIQLHLGWERQEDGRWSLGLPVENGRVADREPVRLRSALRQILHRVPADVRLTPQQDLLLTGIDEADRDTVESLLVTHGVRTAAETSRVRGMAMACPALPTCGLALAEAERALPGVLTELEQELQRLGLDGEVLSVRMTGCPNGCARPYVADIGFVGRSLDRYAIRIGGSATGAHLNRPWLDLVPTRELVPRLVPLLEAFAARREPGERLGDFCRRLGDTALDRLAEPSLEEVP